MSHRFLSHRARARRFLSAMVLVGLSAPLAAGAQQSEVPRIPDDRMTVYAATYRDVSQLRDDMYNRLARTHDREGKERLREELNERLAALYEEHGMPAEEYQQITYVVSVDQAQREIFEAKLAQLSGAAPPS